MVDVLFCGGVFYGPLSGTLVFGVLAAGARGGWFRRVGRSFEMPKRFRFITQSLC